MDSTSVPGLSVLVLAALVTAPAAAPQGMVREHHALTAFEDSTHGLVLLDFDLDGDRDLLELNGGIFGATPNRLHRHDGQGTFTVAASFLFAPDADSRAGAVGDLDGDGHDDVYVANAGQDQVLVTLSGFLVAGAALPPDGATSSAVALGDVDGDGFLDALVGTDGGQNRLVLNDGTGTFSDATGNLPALLDATAGVALGDLDGDGDLDAVVANRFEPDRLHHNDGSGLFTDASLQMPVDLDDSRAAALVDVNNDGTPDFLTPTRLYLADGTGALAASAPGAYPGPGGWALDTDDLDGDGQVDVLTADGLLLGNGSGSFTDASAPVALPPGTRRAVRLGDLDADGDPDALFGLELVGFPITAGARNRLFLNDGLAGLTDATEPAPALPPNEEQTTAAALGDLDGDGDLDAFLTHLRDQAGGSFEVKTGLFLNGGTGIFSDGSAGLPLEHALLMDVALADADGDGDLDALIAAQDNSDGTGGGLLVYANDGAANFTPLGSHGFWNLLTLEVADVDGDGDVDAFLGSDWAQIPFSSSLRLNDGAGSFAATAGVPPTNDTNEGVVLADLDGDGDLDAYLANRPNFASSGADRLWLGDGSGTFLDDSGQLPGFLDSGLSVAAGDTDNDGDLDLLVGNDGVDRLLLNLGGAFTDGAIHLPFLAGRSSEVYLGDLDLDGDVDGLVADDGGVDSFLTNDGAGNFAIVIDSAPQGPRRSRGLAVGDVDRDGDLDVYFARAGRVDPPIPLTTGSRGPDALWLNQRRGLRWLALPRLGKPLRFEVCGQAVSPYLLGVSLAPADLQVPPFGVLFLDPGSLQVLAAGSTAAPPNCTVVTFAIPANPALVGTAVYAQALVDAAPRLTNLETVIFTDL